MEKLNMSKKFSFSVRISEGTRKYVHGDTLEELVNAVVELRDEKFVREFVQGFSQLSRQQLNKLEQVVLASNNIVEIYKYITNVKELINIEKFEDLIIESGDNERISKFASSIIGANIEKLENAVIQSKNKRGILQFYKLVKGSNYEKIKRALLNSENNADAIYEFFIISRNKGHIMQEDEIREIDDAIIGSNNDKICLSWAQTNTVGMNISKLEDIVINGNHLYSIYAFASSVNGANIERLEDAFITFINSSNVYKVNDFAKTVKGANIAKLEDVLIKFGNSYYIYYFAKEIEGANLYKLRKALKATKNKKYINLWWETFGTKGLFKNK